MGLPLRAAVIAAAGTLGLAGCASDYGYGYGGVSVGYGTNGYCDPYYGCDYGPYGYGGYGGYCGLWGPHFRRGGGVFFSRKGHFPFFNKTPPPPPEQHPRRHYG